MSQHVYFFEVFLFAKFIIDQCIEPVQVLLDVARSIHFPEQIFFSVSPISKSVRFTIM